MLGASLSSRQRALADAGGLLQQARASATGFARLPHQAWALAVCTLALLLGVVVADDYGVWIDAYDQRAVGEATLRHLAGENGLNLIWSPWIRLYGPIFETPLAVIERILGRDDSRHVFLSRHLLTHFFFVAAGFAGYLLAYRLLGSRWLALFALLLFLLHPRIYAHSFFNSKDLPFLAMFMICLWLAHRAFGSCRSYEHGTGAKDVAAINGAGTAYGAFALCGVAAGLLTNLRILGLVFVAAVFFARFCDAIGTDAKGRRGRVAASALLFALASVVVYYATMPYLWADPVERFGEMLSVLSSHPVDIRQLFQGQRILSSERPPSYLPVLFGIMTPPLALFLGVVGFAALVWRVVTAPKALLRNTALRFEVLAAACFVLPVLAVMVTRPTFGWNHFFFLWAPVVLLATSGLHTLVHGARRFGGTPLVSTAIVGLAAIGLGATAVEMARLHPHQNLYFNLLANRAGATPPGQRFQLVATFAVGQGYAHILEEIEEIEELADREGADAVFNIDLHGREQNVRGLAPLGIVKSHMNMELFRQRDQRRFKYDPNADVDFYVKGRGRDENLGFFPPVLYQRKVYGQEIVRVATPDLTRVDESTANDFRATYRAVTSKAPVFGGDVDIYRGETAISWVKAPCAPGDVNGTMDTIVVPLDATSRRYTHRARGVRVGDACLWQARLPDHGLAKLVFPGIGSLAFDAYLAERRRRYATLAATQPVARSTFDVYRQEGTLSYVKTPCVQADVAAPFFVHVRPARLGDLPSSRRGHGFDVLDFRFGAVDPHWGAGPGDIFDGVCMAELELPDYSVAGIGTGQFVSGGGSLWRVDIGG